jgi:hypothetical protein
MNVRSFLFLLITIGWSVVFISCQGIFGPKEPETPCENLSFLNFKGSTEGFPVATYDTIWIETYVKNSKFDQLKWRYLVRHKQGWPLDEVNGNFDFPNEVTTYSDIRIRFSKDIDFKLTELQTAWVAPKTEADFYKCTITTYKLNGKPMDYNGFTFVAPAGIP